MSLSRRSVMQSAVLGSVAALVGVAGSAQAKIKKPLPAQKVSEKRRVLIQLSSRYHTSGYLDFAGEQYEQLYGSSKHEILFIPYAKVAGTYDGYEKQVQDAFKPFGHKIVSIHRFKDPQKAVREASAIAVGGGNTWALVTRMYEAGIIDQIRDRVNGGIPYCGWSAGGNVACPTLRTTNDMPIAEPPSFNTFGFIPFQTNPHFISAAGTSGLNNETREDRLEEFLWYNKDEEVIGLPESTALFVTGERLRSHRSKDAEALTGFRRAGMGMRLGASRSAQFDLHQDRPGRQALKHDALSPKSVTSGNARRGSRPAGGSCAAVMAMEEKPRRFPQPPGMTSCDGQKFLQPERSLHRNSRRKPPNSFGWRNAANLSLPIYLVVPDERRVSFHPLC